MVHRKRWSGRNRRSRTKLGHVRINSPEWYRAWAGLAEITQDRDCCAEHPHTHDVWEYVGSVLQPGARTWIHEFRHRTHPSTGQRWMVFVEASEAWRPDDLVGLWRSA